MRSKISHWDGVVGMFSPWSKYPRWRKNRSRRLKISVQKPAVQYGWGRQSNAYPLTTTLFPSSDPSDISFKRRYNRSSPPRSFLHSSPSCFLHVDLDTTTTERLPFCKLNILYTEEQLTCLVFRVCKFLQGVPKVCLLDRVTSLSHAFSHVRCSC